MTARIWGLYGCLCACVSMACGTGAGSSKVESADEAAAGAWTGEPPPGATAAGMATPSGPPGDASSEPRRKREVAPRPQMNAAARQAYQAGLTAFRGGDLQGAKTQFSRAVSADARAYQALYSLGSVHERLGNEREAIAAYKRALSVVPDYEAAIRAHADLLARSGDLAAAEQYLQGLRSRLPDSAAVLAALSEIKSLRKDSAAAQRLAQEALKRDPDYRPAMLALARDHYRSRRLDLALYTLKAILDGYGPENPPRDKDNAAATLLRALILKEQGRRAAALPEFKRALELRPDLVEARLNLAKYMLEAGNANDGAVLLEEALRFDADNVLVHLALGDAYRLQGRPGPAIEHLEWVLGQDSSIAAAEYNLGLLYLLSAEVPGISQIEAAQKAIDHLSRYREMQPKGHAGSGDDVDALLQRARNKKAVVEALAAQPAPAAPPPEQPAGAAAQPPAGNAPPAEQQPENEPAESPGSTGSFGPVE